VSSQVVYFTVPVLRVRYKRREFSTSWILVTWVGSSIVRLSPGS
jgi:hypothetical protein